MFKLLALFVGSLVLSYGAIGAETHKLAGDKVDIKKINQVICPVMGRKINPKLYYKYKGQKIYVCCQGCISAVKKNPEKYLKKVHAEQQKALAVANKNITQKTCPVTGEAIVSNVYYQYKGHKIYACCQDCIATIKKNPETYLKKVQQEIAAAKKK